MKLKACKIFAILISLIIIFSFSCQKHSKLFTIGIVQINESPALNEGREGIIEALKSEGYNDGENIKINYKNAQDDIAAISQILQSFKMDEVDLIITISTPCMAAAAQQIKDIPVIFTIAFSPDQIGIKNASPNLTGLYDPLDMNNFLDFIKMSIPGFKRLGIPFNSSEPNAVFASNKIKDVCEKNNIEAIKMSVTSSNDVMQVCEALAQKNIDAFASSADNTFFLSLESVIKIAKKYKVPIFTTEPTLAEKGVAAGIGIDYKEWGKNCGKITAEIARGKKITDFPIKPLLDNKIFINPKAAAEQGLVFPDTILKKANKIIE